MEGTGSAGVEGKLEFSPSKQNIRYCSELIVPGLGTRFSEVFFLGQRFLVVLFYMRVFSCMCRKSC